MFSHLLAAAIAVSPTVDVNVEAVDLPAAAASRLHGETLARLLEAGWSLGRPGIVQLRMTGGGAVIHVEAQHGRVVVAQDVRGTGAVQRLAAAHASVNLLAQLRESGPPLDAAIAPHVERTVVVETDAQARSALPRVLQTLVDSGWTVAAGDEAPIRICLTAPDELLRVAVAGGEDDCPPGTPMSDLGTDLPPLLAAYEGVRAESTAEGSDPGEPAARVVVDTRSLDGSAPAAAKPVAAPPWHMALGGFAGAQGRLTHAEPTVGLQLSARAPSGASVALRAETAPFVASEPRVVDTFVTLQGGWRFQPHPRVGIDALAGAGVLVHAFSVAGDRGSSADFVLAGQAGPAFALARRVELALLVSGGWSMRRREHVVDGDRAWRRDAWRVGAVAQLSVYWSIHRRSRSRKLAGRSMPDRS